MGGRKYITIFIIWVLATHVMKLVVEMIVCWGLLLLCTGQIFGNGALLSFSCHLPSVNWFLCSSIGHIWIFMFFIFSWGLVLSVACCVCRCCSLNFLLLSWNEVLIFLSVLRRNAVCLCLILFLRFELGSICLHLALHLHLRYLAFILHHLRFAFWILD